MIHDFLLTILIETPVLLVALSGRHPYRRRLFAGFWLTACTYPVVVLVIPFFLSPVTARGVYLLTAEPFAPLAECLLFWFAFDVPARCSRGEILRDSGAIIVANLASFGVGELLHLIRLPYHFCSIDPLSSF